MDSAPEKLKRPTPVNASDSDEERFENASSKGFNEAAVDEVIEQVTGVHIGNSPRVDTSAPSEQTEKFVDCRSDCGSDGEETVGKELKSGHTEDDFVDDESQRDFEKALTEEEKQANKLKADELKNEGNDLFRKGDFEKSANVYTGALRICPVEYSTERSILYANRAAAKTKLNYKPSAIEDCTKALEHNPNYLKALLRRAALYEEQDKLDESLEDSKKILELDPSNVEARAAQTRLAPKIEERNERLKQEMMSKLKDLGNMILRPFGLSTQNFEMKQDSSGSYSINFKNK
ncbi:tetratricopeptide repeat protein 1 [Toxorhynchites rutilus septentrionalis]|uniref:tetratricopeptide repeat protein 1 n=1 Tax=Toxorhynchites rutilus septentrionalis TaxID=329112 RepID=UPI00247B0085|nr:tetratricopeptide repeat protein 1 [Toxorhynchites rutilus septentrionalis]